MKRSALWAAAMVSIAALDVGCGDDGAGAPGGGGEGGAPTPPASSTSSGQPTCDDLDCGADEFCYAGACRACDAPLGTAHDQVLASGDGNEDRFYFLHVPASYSCAAPAPLLVDFHGTSGGERPEETYQLDALIALAEAKGAIVVRPRSRSSDEGGFGEIYRWDQNPGDLERNVAFALNLVESLRSRYRIDAARSYASGFSSGSNMTSQFLGAGRGVFRGLAPIAGGVWSALQVDAFEDGEAPRLYLATGHRDYLYGSMRDLLARLSVINVPASNILVREYDTGHDLFPWHFEELWAFLDEGVSPIAVEPEPPWTEETPPEAESILSFAQRPDGSLVATGVEGKVWLRTTAGAWSLAAVVPTGGPLTGSCVDGTGRVYVAGEQYFAAGSAALVFEAPKQVPEFFGGYFGASYLNGVGCAGGSELAAGGYWTGVRSSDGGDSWAGLAMDVGGYTAQASAVHVTDAGTIFAVGYPDYVGRGDAAATELVAMDHPSGSDWLNDVASVAGGWLWVVGDRGTILHSSDDGLTWEAQDSTTTEDLYAVAFADVWTGAAVGRRGTVVVTRDAGATWESLAVGMDMYLGAAAFVGPTELLVAGESGRVLRTDLAR